METRSLKAIAAKRLQVYQQGNSRKTAETLEETFSGFQVSTPNRGNKETDLPQEDIKQTEHNLPLQAKLLRQHCPERFTGEGWLAIIRQWIERARTLFEDQHLGLHEANWQAATEMNLLAFADELLLKKAQPT